MINVVDFAVGEDNEDALGVDVGHVDELVEEGEVTVRELEDKTPELYSLVHLYQCIKALQYRVLYRYGQIVLSFLLLTIAFDEERTAVGLLE